MPQRAQWAPDPVESPQPVHVVHARLALPGASGFYLSPRSPRPGSADSWPDPTRGLPGATPSKTERQRVGVSLGNEAVPPRTQTHARSPLPGSPASAARGKAPPPDQSRQKALLPGSPPAPGQPWQCAPNPHCCPATPLRLCCSAVLSAPPRLPHRVLGSALLCAFCLRLTPVSGSQGPAHAWLRCLPTEPRSPRPPKQVPRRLWDQSGATHTHSYCPCPARTPRGSLAEAQGQLWGRASLPRGLTLCAVFPAEGEVSAEEEDFENLNTVTSTFIVLFLLSVFYSTTVTLFKVTAGPGQEGAGAASPGQRENTSRRLSSAGEMTGPRRPSEARDVDPGWAARGARQRVLRSPPAPLPAQRLGLCSVPACRLPINVYI